MSKKLFLEQRQRDSEERDTIPTEYKLIYNPTTKQNDRDNNQGPRQPGD
jgi:hypothetical protein